MATSDEACKQGKAGLGYLKVLSQNIESPPWGISLKYSYELIALCRWQSDDTEDRRPVTKGDIYVQ